MIIANQFTNYFTITNVHFQFTNYNVFVTNAARPAGVPSSTAILTLLSDGDGDGIPDEWEIRYGLLAGDPSDRDGDLDEDGMSNWAEYIAGTEPNSARTASSSPTASATWSFISAPRSRASAAVVTIASVGSVYAACGP